IWPCESVIILRKSRTIPSSAGVNSIILQFLNVCGIPETSTINLNPYLLKECRRNPITCKDDRSPRRLFHKITHSTPERFILLIQNIHFLKTNQPFPPLLYLL